MMKFSKTFDDFCNFLTSQRTENQRPPKKRRLSAPTKTSCDFCNFLTSQTMENQRPPKKRRLSAPTKTFYDFCNFSTSQTMEEERPPKKRRLSARTKTFYDFCNFLTSQAMERSPTKRSRPAAAAADRISELPVDVRLHILSLLTTKSAVKTGVLSKGWARLWTASPVLCFDQHDFETAAAAGGSDPPPSSTASFVNFVDRVLALRGSCSITRFELQWKHGFDNSKVIEWLHYAVSQNVKLISIYCNSSEILELPDSLFCCRSLEHLSLKASFLYRSFFSVPTSMNWSKLRSLRLESIFTVTTFLGDVISNCPVLERLKIAVVDHADGATVLSISAPKLRRLDLRSELSFEGSRIQILTPRLEKLSFTFNMIIPEINLEELWSLEYAKLVCATWKLGNAAKLFCIRTSLGSIKTLFFQSKSIEINEFLSNVIGLEESFRSWAMTAACTI